MEYNIIDILLDHNIQHNTISWRKDDSQFLQIRYSANILGNSFFPTTIKEWHSLPPSTISSKFRRPTMREEMLPVNNSDTEDLNTI